MNESPKTALAEHLNTMLGYWVRQIAEEAVESFVTNLARSLRATGNQQDLWMSYRVEEALHDWQQGR